MRQNRRLTIGVFFAVLSSLLLAGCGKQPLPETTGEEAGIYILSGRFVNADAEEYIEAGEAKYRFDEDGNVVTKGEKRDTVVIAAENVAYFSCIDEAKVNEEDTRQEIPVYILSDGSKVFGAVTWELPVELLPLDALNKKVTVETADANTLYFNERENRVETDGTKPLTLKLTGCYAGETKLLVSNCLGEVICTIELSLTAVESQDTAAIEDIETRVAECEHEYEAEVILPTETAEGYTQHTCKNCGHIYRDTYTEKLPCAHAFNDREITATCTEQGYTLRTCSKCGYTEKTKYTALAEHIYRDEIVPASCKEQGYTRHTCTICGHVEKDSYTQLAEHSYRTEAVPSTCSEQGCTLHTCTGCSYSYKDSYTATKEHTYLVSTVAPTYTERGYTLHTCSVCGSSYMDNYVEKLACTNHSYVESGRKESSCTAAGKITKTCSRCGSVTTETIPALGHKYSETVVQPTCTAQGHTTHTCSVCGSSYTDTTVPALGHEWSAHEEKVVVGSVEHTFCSVCGADMTAGGLGSAHSQAHALAGEGGGSYTSVVPIYETKTVETCTRCGAKK